MTQKSSQTFVLKENKNLRNLERQLEAKITTSVIKTTIFMIFFQFFMKKSKFKIEIHNVNSERKQNRN